MKFSIKMSLKDGNTFYFIQSLYVFFKIVKYACPGNIQKNIHVIVLFHWILVFSNKERFRRDALLLSNWCPWMQWEKWMKFQEKKKSVLYERLYYPSL